jgi:hypothetical protein
MIAASCSGNTLRAVVGYFEFDLTGVFMPIRAIMGYAKAG